MAFMADVDSMNTVLGNIAGLICDKLRERSAIRATLIGIVFEGIQTSVVSKILRGQFSNRYILDCLNVKDHSGSPLFSAKIPHSPHKVLREDEKMATIEVMHGEFEQRSGQRYNTLLTHMTQSEIYNRYLDLYPEIRRAVINRGKDLRVGARSMKTLFYRIFEEYNIYRVKKPHSCPHCNEEKTNVLRDTTMPELRAKLATAETSEKQRFLTRQIERVKTRLALIPEHKKRMKIQRKFYKDLRDSLADDQCILVMDFVSWYFPKDPTGTTSGTKCNDLVITLEFREQGNLRRKYFDFPCHNHASNEHDHFFFAQALLFLFTKTTHLIVNNTARWHRIYRVSDNGGPFKSYASLFVESFMAMRFGVEYHVVALCPYHAYSICDSHGSQIKRKLNKHELAGSYPYEDNSLKSVLESLKNTYCYPQHSIDRTYVNDNIYDLIDGHNRLKNFGGIRRVGYIRYAPGDMANKNTWGHIFTRDLCGEPDNWPWDVPEGHAKPSETFRTMNSWSTESVCERCSSLKEQPVFGEHICTIKEIRAKRGSRRRPPVMDMTILDMRFDDGEDDSEYLPSDDELSVSSADDGDDEETMCYLRAVVDHGPNDEGEGYLYRLRWCGYPPDKDTWQLESTIPPEILQAYRDSVYY